MEYTHIIVFKDGSKKQISQSAFNTIMGNSGDNQKIIVDGSMYDLNMIAKLMPLSEYYEQHPESRPDVLHERTLDEIAEARLLYKPITMPITTEKRRDLILEGIKRSGNMGIYNEIKKSIDKHKLIHNTAY